MAGSHNRKKTAVRIAFGKIIRKKRRALDLSQEKLAEKTGLHPTYIGSLERGERNVSLENILLIAKGLGCSPKDFLPD